jgi:putative membrane protein
MMYYGYGGGWLMWLIFIAIIGAIVWGVVAATRHSGGHHEIHGTQTPLEIAKERYARGEITRDQYEQLRKDLS